MPKNRRVTLPVLLALVVFLVGSAYLMHRMQASAARHGPGAVSYAGPIEPDSADQGSTWRHHAWGPSERSERTGPTPDGLPAASPDDEPSDPQMAAMRRSFRLDTDASTGSLPFEPFQRRARIVDSEGALPVSRNASCEVRVLPVQTYAFNCLVRVMCEGRVLYPNPEQTAGYAPCEVEDGRPLRAVDDGHTAADGDPLVRVDVQAGTVTVEDR